MMLADKQWGARNMLHAQPGPCALSPWHTQGQAAKMLDGACEGRPGCSEAAAQLVKGSSG